MRLSNDFTETRAELKRESMSYDTVNRWLSRIDKDEREARDAAVQSLYLQCHTKEEIAAAVGMPETSVVELLAEIRKYGIPPIPGIFAENPPEDSAPEKVKKEWEEARQAKILEANRKCHGFGLARRW